MMDAITQVALDAHKKEHKVAMLSPGRDEPEEWTVANERREIRRMVRRVLIEAGWHQGRSAVTSRTLRRRRAGQPAWAVGIAERAQRRLYRRCWGLVRKGKSPQKAVTAVARELAGFIWSMLCGRHATQPEEAAAARAAPEKVSSEQRSTN